MRGGGVKLAYQVAMGVAIAAGAIALLDDVVVLHGADSVIVPAGVGALTALVVARLTK